MDIHYHIVHDSNDWNQARYRLIINRLFTFVSAFKIHISSATRSMLEPTQGGFIVVPRGEVDVHRVRI